VTLRSAFDLPAPLTVGLEEELMLLDGETLDLAPRAPDVMDAVGDDPRFKPELPLAQLEIVTPPAASVPEAMAAVAGARRDLAAAAANRGLRLGGAGVHPFAAPAGELNPAERYERTRSEYAWVARRQLVFAFQIHVAVRPADRALAVYNALRSYLPELAALAANAPWYAGEDTGLASVRPKLSETLPRQGVPPPVASWEELEAGLAWGMASGTVPEPRIWWWELRPHPTYGTLEIRVPDTQATVADASGIAAVAHALIHHLAARADAADLPPAAPTWRIEENRWAACRHGLTGSLADLDTGARTPTRERVAALLDVLEPHAREVGAAEAMRHARALVAENGAERLRAAGERAGAHGVAAHLADRFLAGAPG
jgi:carboxylate-amine ligase